MLDTPTTIHSPVLRSRGVGASEVGAVVGVDDRRSAFDVYAVKRGLVTMDFSNNQRVQWGRRIQQAIAQGYEEQTGRVTVWDDKIKAHHKRQWHLFTPDAFCAHEPGLVECKNLAFDQRDRFGEPGTDQVPDVYNCQAHWQMAGAEDREWVDFAVLVGGNSLQIYRVDRDREIEGILIETVERFWFDNVLAQKPPEMRATDTARLYLKTRFPRNSGTLRTPTGDEMVLIESFLLKRAVLKAATKEYDDAEVKIKAAIGDDDGWRFAGTKDRITYKRIADTSGVKWEDMARFLAAQEDLAAMERRFYGVTRFGYRRLDCRVSEAK